MIWACFVGDKLGRIVFISGSVNQDVYMEMLRTDFDPYLEALATDTQTTYEFQQDNARPHTPRRTVKFLEVLAKKHRVDHHGLASKFSRFISYRRSLGAPQV